VSCTASDTHLNTAATTFPVTVQDTTAPALLGLSRPITVDATSPSGAVLYYGQPTARDLVDGSLAVSCSPPKGSVFPIGTTVVKCAVADAHRNVASGAFTVTVNGASAQIAALIKKLDGSSLTKALYAAQDALRIPELEGACPALTRFGGDVRAAEAARQLGSTEASSLLSSLGQIKTVTGCKP
jgi:HYR domain